MNAQRAFQFGVFTVLTVGAVLALPDCGGGSYGSSSPSGPSPTPSMATITIGSSGLSPKQLSITVGQQVRIVNNDTVNHEIHSNPHPAHTDCPPLNTPGLLAPGQSGTTNVFDRTGTCGYHDHLNARNETFQGQILIGVNEPGPAPGYLVP